MLLSFCFSLPRFSFFFLSFSSFSPLSVLICVGLGSFNRGFTVLSLTAVAEVEAGNAEQMFRLVDPEYTLHFGPGERKARLHSISVARAHLKPEKTRKMRKLERDRKR
jgi:hypothetical protein